MKKENSVFAKQTVEFVTVAAEYCAFIEKANVLTRPEFVDKSIKLLPLLYLKSLLLPQTEFTYEQELERFVDERSYEYIRSSLASVMGAQDDYPEVFVADMQYSEKAISANISEDMTDIYQDLKDFISVYSMGYEATMQEALAQVNEKFKEDWGQKLVNVLRPLHSVCFKSDIEDEDTASNYVNDESSENWLFDSQKGSLDEDELDKWNG